MWDGGEGRRAARLLQIVRIIFKEIPLEIQGRMIMRGVIRAAYRICKEVFSER